METDSRLVRLDLLWILWENVLFPLFVTDSTTHSNGKILRINIILETEDVRLFLSVNLISQMV